LFEMWVIVYQSAQCNIPDDFSSTLVRTSNLAFHNFICFQNYTLCQAVRYPDGSYAVLCFWVSSWESGHAQEQTAQQVC